MYELSVLIGQHDVTPQRAVVVMFHFKPLALTTRTLCRDGQLTHYNYGHDL